MSDKKLECMSAAERSEVYRVLAAAFSYAGAQTSPFHIEGADYNNAFDPAVNEDACSLREGAHIKEEQSALFEELVRFYEFFGLGRGEGAEMPDHLSVELEFMHYLTHLEDHVADRPDELASVRRAQHDFVVRHLSRLMRGLQSGFKSRNPNCVELVEACTSFIDTELAYVKSPGL